MEVPGIEGHSKQDRNESAKAWKHEGVWGIQDIAEQTGEQCWILLEWRRGLGRNALVGSKNGCADRPKYCDLYLENEVFVWIFKQKSESFSLQRGACI